MMIHTRHSLRAIAASLAIVAILSACADNTVATGTTSGSDTSTTASSIPPTTTAAVVTTPAEQEAQTKAWFDLEVGDCVSEVPAVDLGVVIVGIVGCATPHQAEVYLRVPIAVNAAIADVANTECAAGLPEYTGRPVAGGAFAVTYLIDSNQDRTRANPLPSTVICLLQAANGEPLMESARR